MTKPVDRPLSPSCPKEISIVTKPVDRPLSIGENVTEPHPLAEELQAARGCQERESGRWEVGEKTRQLHD